MPDRASDLSLMAIQKWLVERVAVYVDLPATEISTAVNLARYGLESVYALSLSGDAEEYLGVDVDPTLAWDHPTIDDMAQFLHELVSANLRPAGESGQLGGRSNS